jgi:hypothetical protein
MERIERHEADSCRAVWVRDDPAMGFDVLRVDLWDHQRNLRRQAKCGGVVHDNRPAGHCSLSIIAGYSPAGTEKRDVDPRE